MEDIQHQQTMSQNIQSTQENHNLEEHTKTDDEFDISMEELLKYGEDISEKLYNYEPVYVSVVDIRQDYVYVDIGEKNEGLIPVSDFAEFKLPNVGSKIVAILEKKGNAEKPAILSYRKAKEKITMKMLEEKFNKRERVRGRIVEHVKGGYIVSINGVKAFMPLSLSEIGGAPKHYLPVGAKVKFYIITFEPSNKKIIVSRRMVLEEDEKARREKVISQIQEGVNVRVVVSRVMENGIFVRFQGIEGFVKLEDVDWKKPKEEILKYKRGQRIKVKILSIDRENQKIFFGIKQTKPNPAEILKRRFPLRSIVKGKVVEVGEKFVKVHIVDDVYGIIPEEEYGYDTVPQKDVVVDAAVVGIDHSSYELKLSIKRYEQIENRKTIEYYKKQAPKITLGQLLKDTNNSISE